MCVLLCIHPSVLSPVPGTEQGPKKALLMDCTKHEVDRLILV